MPFIFPLKHGFTSPLRPLPHPVLTSASLSRTHTRNPATFSNMFRFLARAVTVLLVTRQTRYQHISCGLSNHKTGPLSGCAHYLRFNGEGERSCASFLSGNGQTPLIWEAGVFRHACTHTQTHARAHTHTVSRTEANSCRVRGRAVSCSRQQGHSTGSGDQHLYTGTHLPQCPTRGPRDTMQCGLLCVYKSRTFSCHCQRSSSSVQH